MPPTRFPGTRRPETLLQQSGEPVFLLSATGQVLYVNAAWEELTGEPAAEVVGRDFHAGFEPGTTTQGLAESFRPPPEAMDGRPTSTTAWICRSDGQRLWRRLEFWPHRDRSGRLLFVMGLVRPIEAPPHAPESPAMSLRAELWRVRDQLLSRFGTDTMIGRGPAHRRLLDQIETAAMASVPILILGPPGSGKRQVGRAIHRRAGRVEAPLIPIDCAALPADVLERELFGTSSDGDRLAPRLELAKDATLLLGDVLDLPRDVQRRLASVLSRGTILRVLATTSGDPEAAVRDERLLPDLYYALTTLPIQLKPLRDRLDELPLLAQHFLERVNLRVERRREGFDPGAIDTLIRYDWPGNLRELSHVVETAHERASGAMIGLDDLPASIRGHLGGAYTPPPMPEESLPLDAMLERLEHRLIERALRSSRGNKSLAAKILHISRTRLHRRIQELNLQQGEPESDPDSAGPGGTPEPGGFDQNSGPSSG